MVVSKRSYTYAGEDVVVTLEKYTNNNNLAVRICSLDGEPYCSCSVNPGFALEEDEIVVKDYSENEGILEWILGNDLAEITGKVFDIGFKKLNIVKIDFSKFHMGGSK